MPRLNMKTAIKFLSMVALTFGLFVIATLFWLKTPVRAAFTEFPVGQKRAISFEVGRETLAAMTRREQLDQMRDWLLYTVVSEAGLTAEEFNQSLFDLPAIRRGYLQPTANFEHGVGRSCYIGDGRVVALVPAGIEPNERADQIAHIADLHRKNTGETLESLIVFEYGLAFVDLDNDSAAELTRRETIDAEVLFTSKYNYREATINNLADLELFMSHVDDLVYARVDGGTLTVGGRKLRGHKYRGIRVEEIAAIWQSEDKIQKHGIPLKEKIDEFNRRWASRLYYTELEKARLDAEYKLEEADLKKEIARAERSGASANGSGFSLDPAYNFVGLKKFFDQKLGPLCSRYIGPDKVAEISQALADENIDQFFDALFEISKTNKLLATMMEQSVTYNFTFQAARYDGDLRGTEAGMVLFYTDLLAKLWALDFLESAPSAFVDDFRPIPEVAVSPIYQQEMKELSRTRLWFGPQDKGFQVADNGKNLLFAHTATRIYAASANSLQPGKESEPNAQSAAFLGWWDNHYEEVARYEPEYQQLNQIMKWSLLIGWLNENNQGQQLKFLQGVQVKRDNWFPDWAKQHPELRFRAWGGVCKEGPMIRDAKLAPQVCFFPRDFGGRGMDTEAMPRLASRPFSQFGQPGHILNGGVSLAERTMFRTRAPLSASSEVGALMRRSNLKYGTGGASEGLQTLEGARFGFRAVSRDSSLMTASAKDGARLRGMNSEWASKTQVERTVNSRGIGVEVETRANGAELGRLNITRSANGFRVGWQSREIDLAQNFTRTLSRNVKAVDLAVIGNDSRVAAAIKLPGDQGYAVCLRDTNRWFRMAEDSSTANLAEGWHSRVASLNGGRQFKLAFIDKNDFAVLTGKENYVMVSQSAGSEGAVTMEKIGSRAPATARPYQVEIDGKNINALHDPNGGRIYLKGEDISGFRGDPNNLGRLFGANKPPVNGVADALGRGDYRKAINEMALNVAGLKYQLNTHYAKGLESARRLVAEGKYSQAVKELDGLSAVHGRQPEISALRGLAMIGQRSPKVALAINQSLPGFKDSANFFKEVNQRLASNGFAPADGTVSLVYDGKGVAMHYHLSSPLHGAPAFPADLHGQRVIVIVQDSPGLNNLNWGVNVERATHEAVSLNLGQLNRLNHVGIAEFRPNILYAPEKSAVNTSSSYARNSYRVYYPSGPSNYDDGDDDEDEEVKKEQLAKLQQTQIFILTASNKVISQK